MASNLDWRMESIKAFEFDGGKIPDYMVDGLARYLEYGVEPGDFLSSVLRNDLMGAVGKADSTNINLLKVYAGYLYNNAPIGSHGSDENYTNWVSAGGAHGLYNEPEGV